MHYSPGKKGRDDLFKCSECDGYLDEDGIRLNLLNDMFKADTLSGTMRVTTTCDDCGADLVAYIEVHLQTDNEVFSLLSEDDEPENEEAENDPDDAGYTTFSNMNAWQE